MLKAGSLFGELLNPGATLSLGVLCVVTGTGLGFLRGSKVMKFLISCVLSLVMVGCGGGADPFANGVQTSLMYGKQSSITLGGFGLRNDMVADLGPACTNPVWSPASEPSLATLLCTPTVVGDVSLSLKTKDGDAVFSTTVSVPKPQVKYRTSAGDFTFELDPVAAPNTVDNFLTYVRSGFYL